MLKMWLCLAGVEWLMLQRSSARCLELWKGLGDLDRSLMTDMLEAVDHLHSFGVWGC